MSKTIEVVSIHKGTISVPVKGENRRIKFEDKGAVGVALCDHDEAAVLLGLPGKDYWKEGAVVDTQDKTQGDGLTAELYSAATNLNTIKPLVAKCEDKELLVALVEIEAAKEEPREKWLATLNGRIVELG